VRLPTIRHARNRRIERHVGDRRKLVQIPRSVLILEDEYLIAAALAQAVAEAGCRVVGPVPDTEQAQALINETGIDAALLDIRLSDGERSFALAERLQAMRVPFAFITAYSRKLLPAAFQQVPVLAKPVAAQEVAQLLRRLLPARATDAP
jgi:DNA-binding NtrC family response regulator